MGHEMLPVALVQQEVLATALSGATLVAFVVVAFTLRGRLKELERAIAKSTQEKPGRLDSEPRGNPEQSDRFLGALTTQTRWLRRLESSLDAVYCQLTKPMARSLQQLSLIADELDCRRAEVESFRKGQEGMVAKRMLGEVVRIRCEFAEEAKDPRTPEAQRDLYDALLQLVDDHLQSSGVEQRAPRLGSEFRGNELCEDMPRTIACDDPELDWTIASVEEPAWVYEEGSKLTVLGKARVTIHRRRPGHVAEAHG